MPQLPHLQGYRRLPGPARRYLTPSGRTISRYEYDSRRARRVGFKNRGEIERFRQSDKWAPWAHKIATERETPLSAAGLTSPRIGDWQLLAAARDLEQLRAAGASSDVVNDPDGPLALLLVAIGKRDPRWDWPVGDTPAGKRAA